MRSAVALALLLAGCTSAPAAPAAPDIHALEVEASWTNTGSVPIEVRLVVSPGEDGMIEDYDQMLGPHQRVDWRLRLAPAESHNFRMEWRDVGAAAGFGWTWALGGRADCDPGEKLIVHASGGHHDDEPFAVTIEGDPECVPVRP
jgi:hypothetical protein